MMAEPVILLGFGDDEMSRDLAAKVRDLAPGYRVVVTRDRDEIERLLDHVVVAAGRMPRDMLVRAPALRWMQQWSAGTDWLLRNPAAVEASFVLTNASGVHAEPISEHILALLLAFARRVHRAVRAQSEGRWERPGQDGGIFELAGKTMVLVGVGAIGARTAQLASAFGMRVLGVRRDPTVACEGVTSMVGPQDLVTVLPEADFVVLTVPLTRETRHLIGEREIGLMKRSAYLVNIGRGATVDEDALVRALQQGRIAGAGLDVFETEPLPAESSLWGMEEVIITAHYSGRTPHYDERAAGIFLDNLARYVAGRPLRNVVDKRLGY